MFGKIHQDFDDAATLAAVYAKWDPQQTATFQLQKFQEIWCDCIADVPYYRDLVSHGGAPREIRVWEDFRQLPVLTRDILQERTHDFRRISGPPSLERMTGGSTGNPMRFGVWQAEDRIIRLLKLTLWMRAGYRAGDRLFLVWGHSHLLGNGWKRHVNHLKRRIKDQILGYQRVDAYCLDRDRCRAYARQMLAFKPAGVIGYAAALDTLVRHNLDLADQFRELGLRFVMPCAEPPPKPDTLDMFREVFQCPVVQEFGGVDFGQVASQFDKEPFRVFPDQNILETEDGNEQANGSAVLVTSLYRRYLPLIRYRQGDLIEGIQKEPHGHVSSFQQLHGRINDMIRFESGSEVHSVALMHCIHQEREVYNIQVQLTDSGLRILLVTNDGKIDQVLESPIRQRLRKVHPELGNVPISAGTDLRSTVAGKRRWFIDLRTEVEA